MILMSRPRGAAWDRTLTLGKLVHLSDHDVHVISLLDDRITIGTRWAIGDFDTDELIDTSEAISGLPSARLAHVVRYKRLANRAKGQLHLALLAASR